MIEPGEKFVVEYEGVAIPAVCLGRSTQRQVIRLMSELASVDETIDSVEKVFDVTDRLAEICCPQLPESIKERLSNQDILAIVGLVLQAHTIDKETKKKSELPHSSGQENSAEHVRQDVFVMT